MRIILGSLIVLMSPVIAPILFLYIAISIYRYDMVEEQESSIWAWFPIITDNKIFWLSNIIRTPKKDRTLLSLRQYSYREEL